MPPPAVIRPVPEPNRLPFAVVCLATSVLRAPAATSDMVLILADAVAELAKEDAIPPFSQIALRTLASDLRDRAPAYA